MTLWLSSPALDKRDGRHVTTLLLVSIDHSVLSFQCMMSIISITSMHEVFRERREGMDLDALRVFLLAADYQHITRAAEKLALTQPAVSRTIQRLEQNETKAIDIS